MTYLVDLGSVPVPLDDTVTSLCALGADVRHGNVKAGPLRVRGHRRRRQSVLVPADERRADDSVRADFDDRDVCNTVMRGADLHFHRNFLAGTEVVDITRVRKGNTLALPDFAVRVGALQILNGSLNIAVVVGELRVVDLIAANGFEAITRHTRRRFDDETVSSHGRDKARKRDGGGVRLHVDWRFSCVGVREIANEWDKSLAFERVY